MSRYAKIMKNDVANGKGVCVSFWAQGCSFRCPGCHNKDTWDFDGGMKYTQEVLGEIIEAIDANGIKRNLSILGGEPLHLKNLAMVYDVITNVKEQFSNIKVYVWTGYIFEDLLCSTSVSIALKEIDYLVDGQFVENLKDSSIDYAGSSNQRIVDVQASLKLGKTIKLDKF